jgi:hypothetical protein
VCRYSWDVDVDAMQCNAAVVVEMLAAGLRRKVSGVSLGQSNFRPEGSPHLRRRFLLATYVESTAHAGLGVSVMHTRNYTAATWFAHSAARSPASD